MKLSTRTPITRITSSRALLLAPVLLALTLAAGCTNLERSRNWANNAVPGHVLAQQVCSTCHGINGQSSNTLFPKLAGQQKVYIQAQLEAIRARDRNSERTRQFMWGPARLLSNDQIEQLATYFSSQPAMKATAVASESNELGKKLYYQGSAAAGVPACASCHGDAAQGDENIPRLAGQHQYYLVSRARIAMTLNVAHLSDDEIMAIAGYVESIGEGGAVPARLEIPAGAPSTVPDEPLPATPSVFDSGGDASNCHYSVWTYGWYCGSFGDALVFHLKRQ